MRFYTKIFTLSIIGITNFIFFANKILAQSSTDKNTTIGSVLKLTATTGAGFADTTGKYTIASMAGQITFAALMTIGVVFTSLIIYGGYLWMTARGNQEQTKKAKEIITSAIIGVIIVVGAEILTGVVYSAMKVQ